MFENIIYLLLLIILRNAVKIIKSLVFKMYVIFLFLSLIFIIFFKNFGCMRFIIIFKSIKSGVNIIVYIYGFRYLKSFIIFCIFFFLWV